MPLHPTAPPELPRPRLLTALAQAAVLAALPDGGQQRARRNAWAGTVGGAARARTRREVTVALRAVEPVRLAGSARG